MPGRRCGSQRVGESAGADQRGIADPSKKFAGHAAGRGRSRDRAVIIHGDRADRAVSHRRARRALGLEHPALLLSRAPSLACALGHHFLGPHQPDAGLACEVFRAGARHQDVRRTFHHGAREHDWVSHAADRGNRAGRDAVVGCARNGRCGLGVCLVKRVPARPNRRPARRTSRMHPFRRCPRSSATSRSRH